MKKHIINIRVERLLTEDELAYLQTISNEQFEELIASHKREITAVFAEAQINEDDIKILDIEVTD